MTTDVCPSTGKQKMTHREAQDRASWWRRTRHARMSHYKCSRCKTWHIGNNRKKPKTRR